MSSRSQSRRSSSSSLSMASNSSLNIITNEINSLSLIATSLQQAQPMNSSLLFESAAPVPSRSTPKHFIEDDDDDDDEDNEESSMNDSTSRTRSSAVVAVAKPSKSNRRVIRSLLKLIRRRKKLKAATSLNNLDRKSNGLRVQSKSIGNLADIQKPADSSSTSTSTKTSTQRRFRLLKQGSKKKQRSLSVSTSNSTSLNNHQQRYHATAAAATGAALKSLTSSSVYSSIDHLTNSSDTTNRGGGRGASMKTSCMNESFRLMSHRVPSSKELSWYRLEELDYYYKILGMN